jgi:S-adenosyl-l-methionine hydroxide adenosyltransferase
MRFVRRVLGLAAVTALFAFNAAAQQSTKVIGFMTDFDVKDDAVGICKAVMDGVAPGVRIIDITHQSEPYNIAMGARFLAGSAPYFPKDAVFVVVIDPHSMAATFFRQRARTPHVAAIWPRPAPRLT